MSTVIPIAKPQYERREEQTFREWVRRNADQAMLAAQNAAATATAITTLWSFPNLPVYADDTAAGVGGLTQGNFYRTATGVLMVKL
jgi:hypothetical protein